ncbi:MAG: hypothetical protein VST68_05160 [Nitrospirota bacterium]|nr:hypothetical protein [Nitrospirota bacterium]
MLKQPCLGNACHGLIVVFLLGLTALPGCRNRPETVPTYDKIPFTQSLRLEHNLTPMEIRNLQFYVSDPIHLHQSLSSGETEVMGGKLVTKHGKFVEEIIVNKGTPGVAVKVEDQILRISFEEKTSMAFVKGMAPDPDKFFLQLEKDLEDKNAVKFAGSWYASRDKAALAHLLIAKGNLSEVVNKRRVLPGRRIGN